MLDHPGPEVGRQRHTEALDGAPDADGGVVARQQTQVGRQEGGRAQKAEARLPEHAVHQQGDEVAPQMRRGS